MVITLNKLKKIIPILLILHLIIFVITNPILVENGDISKVLSSMTNIALNNEILSNILSSMLNTFIFAYLGLGYGVILASIFTYFGVKYRKFKIGKVFTLFFNSIHELIIVMILSIIWGLNSFVAIIAIALSFSGVISKVFTSNIDNIEDDNFINYKNKGYSFASNFLFNLFPKSFSINVDYISYRFECALRSTVVLSYVGIVGIGFYINLALSDSNYNLVFTYVYALILFMIIVSFIISKLRNIINKNIFKSSIIYLISIIIISVIYIILNYNEFLNLFSNAYFEILNSSIIRVVTFKSSIYNQEFMNEILKYTIQTIRMGLLSTAILMIFVSVYLYILLIQEKYQSRLIKYISQFINIILRSTPELVTLSILIFILKPNIFSGALAIALHNYGIVAKLIYNRFLDNQEKMRIAYNKNYSTLTILIFILYPSLKKYLLSTYIYRYELAIKNSVIIGLLGAGGLGYLFKLKLSSFNYDAVIFICLVYIILFAINEFIYIRFKKIS